MTSKLFTTIIAAALLATSVFAQRFEKASPFDGLRWNADRVEVQISDRWYDLTSIEGHSYEDIMAFCRKAYRRKAGERFVEDLVEVLTKMGTKVGRTVELGLVDLETKKKVTMKDAVMSLDKRQALRGVAEPPLSSGGKGFPKLSPFDSLRWKGDEPEALLGARWYEIISIDGMSRDEILDFCRKTFGARRAKKRFAEDLVEVLTRMGVRTGRTADLVLKDLDSRELVERPKTPMTNAKREAVLRSHGGQGNAAPQPKSRPRELAPADAGKDLERLRWLIEHYYSYRDRLGVDLDSVIETAKTRVGDATDTTAFGIEVMKVLGRFGDGHTRLRGSASILPPGFAPFAIVPHGERFAILRPDGSRLFDDKRPYLHSIDGLPVADWIRAVKSITPRGTEGFERRNIARRLQHIQFARREIDRPETSKIEFRLMNAAGRPGGSLRADISGRPGRGLRRSGHDERVLPGKIGYLRIASMDSGGRFRSWLEKSMERLRGTKGLVIDVRDNGGGSRESLTTLLPYFMAEKDDPVVVNVGAYRLHENDRADDPDGHLGNRALYPAHWKGWSAKERKAVKKVARRFRPDWTLPKGEFSDWHYMVISPERYPVPFHYDRPVVVLTDAGCFSATDIFLGGFQGMRGVTLLGMNSGGGSGRSRSYTLPNSGLEIRLSSMASFRANGDRYDGKGVAPDIEAPYTLQDLTGKKDTLLERAIQRLR